MVVARRSGSVVLAALLLVSAGACTASSINGPEARRITTEALRAGGLRGFVVQEEVKDTRCPREGGGSVAGWTTTAALDDGGTVELCVDKRTAQPVHLRDAGPGGVGKGITDEQFDGVELYRSSGRVGGPPVALVVFAGMFLTAVVSALLTLWRRGDLRSPA